MAAQLVILPAIAMHPAQPRLSDYYRYVEDFLEGLEQLFKSSRVEFPEAC